MNWLEWSALVVFMWLAAAVLAGPLIGMAVRRYGYRRRYRHVWQPLGELEPLDVADLTGEDTAAFFHAIDSGLRGGDQEHPPAAAERMADHRDWLIAETWTIINWLDAMYAELATWRHGGIDHLGIGAEL